MESYEKLTEIGVDVVSLTKRLMGNTTLIKVFIKKFTEDDTFLKLNSAFDDKDIKGAEMASHTLKGMCGNLSLDELYDLFSTQTNFVRTGDFSAAKDMMPNITELYSKTVVRLKEWLLEG